MRSAMAAAAASWVGLLFLPSCGYMYAGVARTRARRHVRTQVRVHAHQRSRDGVGDSDPAVLKAV